MKKKIIDIGVTCKDLRPITVAINKWIVENYFKEMKKAAYNHGKFRLALPFQHLGVQSLGHWITLSEKQQENVIKKITSYR